MILEENHCNEEDDHRDKHDLRCATQFPDNLLVFRRERIFKLGQLSFKSTGIQSSDNKEDCCQSVVDDRVRNFIEVTYKWEGNRRDDSHEDKRIIIGV